MSTLIDFVSFVEVSHHDEEFEWRIVEQHGLTSGKSDTGRILLFSLNDIQQVVVEHTSDIPEIEQQIQNEVKKRWIWWQAAILLN